MTIANLFKDHFAFRERTLTELELADVGLSLSDYTQLVTSKAGTRGRMEALAQQFEVTPAMINADRGLALELALTCGHCQHAQACQNAHDLGVAFNADRCPNASIYQDMSSS